MPPVVFQFEYHRVPCSGRSGVGTEPLAQDFRQLVSLVAILADDVDGHLHEVRRVCCVIDPHIGRALGEVASLGLRRQKQNGTSTRLAHF